MCVPAPPPTTSALSLFCVLLFSLLISLFVCKHVWIYCLSHLFILLCAHQRCAFIGYCCATVKLQIHHFAHLSGLKPVATALNCIYLCIIVNVFVVFVVVVQLLLWFNLFTTLCLICKHKHRHSHH